MDTKLQSQELNLDNIYIIPFLRAMEKGDRKLISEDLSQSEFEKLAQEFVDADKHFESPIEARAHKRGVKMKLISSCLYYLRIDPANEEILKVLEEQKISISRDNYFEDIKKAYKALERLDFLKKQDESKTKSAFNKKKKSKSKEKNSIFDMLTSLSTGLELSLDFNNMVVSEFISYKKALKRKQDALKEVTNKSQQDGKRRK